MVQSPSPQESRWTDRISRSAFFFGALLFHLTIFLVVATWIVWQAPKAPSPDTLITWLPHTPPQAPPPPPKSNVEAPPVNSTMAALTPEVPTIHENPSFLVPMSSVSVALSHDHDPVTPARGPASPTGIGPRLPEIANTVDRYHDPRTTDGPKDLITKPFPVYVASYADGDWACNLQLDNDGNIVAGSIPDLLAKIKEWSHNRIKAEIVPKPLVIGGSELMDKRPPFIFFTGHKDFKLTDQEIQNLREYLNAGGAIWGDNALAGAGSRFDVAFRREMKRVVPDPDKNFVPYSEDAPIFADSYFHLDGIPQGMNYHAELPEHLDIDNVPAIIYTPNDYSDMMFLRLLPGDETHQYPYPNMPPNTLYTNPQFWDHQTVFYRNFNIASTLAVQKLGMNIITYLIVRFDPVLMVSP